MLVILKLRRMMNPVQSDRDQAIWIYMTAAHKRQARNLIRELLKARLIACANFTEQWTSMYWWQGEIQEDRETVIIAKSVQSKFLEIEAKVLELSSYECPCIIAVPIVSGHQPYLQWLEDQTRAEKI